MYVKLRILCVILSKEREEKNKAAPKKDSFVLFPLGVRIDSAILFREKKRDAPKSRKRNKDINDSGEQRGGASRNPCNRIEGEETNEAPVQRADDRDHQRNFVDNGHFFHLAFSFWLINLSKTFKCPILVLPHILGSIRKINR